jgi:hypothetical protein
MKPETQIKYLVKHIQPLAKTLEDYRACARHIHIRRADWRLLHDDPDLARANGFVVNGEHISFRNFELLPTDCGSHRES